MNLEVIGASFGRTGTLSMKAALEELGFGPCYHMKELFRNPEHMGQWAPVVQIAQKFEHFLEVYRRPDGSRWGGQDLYDATGGVVTRSYVSNLRKGRIENPGFEKLRAIAKAMNFPPELWFEDVEDLGAVSGTRPSWFVDREEKPKLLDEELVEALRDETARATLREVARLPERERRIVLGVVRQFQEFEDPKAKK